MVMSAFERRELQSDGGIAFVFEGVLPPADYAAIQALHKRLSVKNTTSLKISTAPEDLPRTEQGFSKELLEEVSEVGHFVTRATFRAFAAPLYSWEDYRISESGFQQRVNFVFDSLEGHIRYGHLNPQDALPERQTACGCCLTGIEIPARGKRRSPRILIPPISFVDAMEGDEPLAGRLPGSPDDFKSGRPALIGRRVLYSAPGFEIAKAYAEALKA